MIGNKSVYGIITARGGSKGIPHKNIVMLKGKPLIAYTIEAALNSKYIDRLIVSTDDDDIAKVALDYKAEVPFKRPVELSGDKASSSDVIVHALEYFSQEVKGLPDIFVLLQPTSPMRTTEDIDQALESFLDSKAKCLKSVCKTKMSPYWFKQVDENGFLSDFLEYKGTYLRRQDTPDLYLLNGAIYIYYSKEVLSRKMLVEDEILAYVMPEERSVDIDTQLDLKYAEFLLEEN